MTLDQGFTRSPQGGILDGRYAKTASSAIRDALRDLLRSGRRRTLSVEEEQMGRAMLDELEARGKAGHRG